MGELAFGWAQMNAQNMNKQRLEEKEVIPDGENSKAK